MTMPAAIPVAILGAGNMAHAAGALIRRRGFVDIAVWARNGEAKAHLADAIGARLAASVADACRDAALIFFAVPAHGFLEVADALGPVARGDQVVAHAARGVGDGCLLPHEMIRARTCIRKIAALGGPLYVDDATEGRPLSVIVASRFDEAIGLVREVTRANSSQQVRIHASHDIAGVEIAGAISNVARIAAGLARGASLGATDEGLLLVRALLEATKLGVALGAERDTFTGLAGLGDLIPRSVTSTRLHNELGMQLARGEQAFSESSLEGPRTAREAADQAERLGLVLPLISAVRDILVDGPRSQETVRERLRGLLAQDLGAEAMV